MWSARISGRVAGLRQPVPTTRVKPFVSMDFSKARGWVCAGWPGVTPGTLAVMIPYPRQIIKEYGYPTSDFVRSLFFLRPAPVGRMAEGSTPARSAAGAEYPGERRT